MTNRVTLNKGKLDEKDPKKTIPPEGHFNSELGKKIFGAKNEKWIATEFHFHAGSEHTIDGERFDLEL